MYPKPYGLTRGTARTTAAATAVMRHTGESLQSAIVQVGLGGTTGTGEVESPGAGNRRRDRILDSDTKALLEKALFGQSSDRGERSDRPAGIHRPVALV